MPLKILLTGKSGFLGNYIYREISSFDIQTLGRFDSDFPFDIRNQLNCDLPFFNLVIHVAGKAHKIPKTIKEKNDFFLVNTIGTQNLLKSLEKSPPNEFVFISSVSVYGKLSGNLIDENEPLLASDPYGLSKVNAERELIEWCKKFNVKLTILRLPLIIGENPPGNFRKMIKGINNNTFFNIDGGKAKKSMVLAEDVAKIITKVSQYGGIYNLTDGVNPDFFTLSNCIAKRLHKQNPPNINLRNAKIIAKIGDLFGNSFPFNSNTIEKMTSSLTFSDNLAREKFNWSPNSVIEHVKFMQLF